MDFQKIRNVLLDEKRVEITRWTMALFIKRLSAWQSTVEACDQIERRAGKNNDSLPRLTRR